MLEDSEVFEATLSLPVGSTGVVLGSSQATAIIQDNDGKLSPEIIINKRGVNQIVAAL